MKYLNFLIKPASSLCNLRCRYCFYADISQHRTEKSMGIMQPETVRLFLQQIFSQIEPRGSVHFAFQGGEPAAAGLSFFQDFTDQVAGFNRKDVAISYSIQTNGTLLDTLWAAFLKQHDFLVGISMDGYKDLHNHYRVDAEENGTWNKVYQTFQMLKDAGVRTNVLCVVTNQCAKHPEKVYRELKKSERNICSLFPVWILWTSAGEVCPIPLARKRTANSCAGSLIYGTMTGHEKITTASAFLTIT